MDDYDIEQAPQKCVTLKSGINLSDLRNGVGVEFTVADDDEVHQEDKYDFDEVQNLSRMDLIDVGDNDTDTHSTPFEALRAKMTDVDPEKKGRVMKRLIRAGTGSLVSPGSTVVFHYNGYFEFRDEPFDSTTLRGKPERKALDCCLLGLEIGIQTMRKNEKAEFILHPSVAYGPLGIAPRIPPNIEVLFEVEVLDFTADIGAEIQGAVSDQEKRSWQKIKAYVVKHCKSAIEDFNGKRPKQAAAKFRQAFEAAESCRLKDEAEENDYKTVCLKIRLNWAKALNDPSIQDQGKSAKQVCIVCREAFKLNPDRERRAKFDVEWAKALIMLNDFETAEDKLKSARSTLRNDNDVAKTMERLEQKKSAQKNIEKEFCKRAFQNSNTDHGDKSKWALSEEFEEFQEILTKFQQGPDTQLVLPPNLNADEMDALEQLASSLSISTFKDSNKIVFRKLKPH